VYSSIDVGLDVGLVLLTLSLLAISARQIFKSWLAPGALFALYWFVASLVPTILLAKHEVSPAALIWIFFAALAVVVGNLFVMKIDLRRIQPISISLLSNSQVRYLKLWVIASAILGTLSVFTALWDSGYSLWMLFSLDSLVSIANAFSVSRYQETYVPSIQTQILLVFTYLSPTIAGFLAATTSKRKDYLFSAISLLPAILLMLVRTERNAFILGIVLWFSAYLVANCVQGRLTPFKKWQVLTGILAFLSLIFVFAFVAMVRAGATDISLLPLLIRKVTAGATGHIAAFSIWFERDGLQVAPSLGQISFAGIFNALGVYTRDLGLFQEVVFLDSGFATNIYTLFRPLIQDFTVIGSLFFLLAFGLVGGVAYQSALKGNIRAVPLLTGIYATILFSFNTSIWIWTSVLAGYVGYIACIWFLPNITSRKLRLKKKKLLLDRRSYPDYRHAHNTVSKRVPGPSE
jgi:oligosaccharide repeat unit polymerase